MNFTEKSAFLKYLSSIGCESKFLEDEVFGSVRVIYIYPTLNCKISKLDKNLKQIGLFFNAISEPTARYNYSLGRYEIEISFSKLESPQISVLDQVRMNGELPILLGKDKYGNLLYEDLASLPNLMIGGTPGSGKSMLMHSILLSLLKTNANIFICDPKIVEFSRYKHVKSIINMSTSDDGLIHQLDELESKMNSTFRKLDKYGCSDLTEYKARIDSKEKYQVLLIDEWADVALKNKNLVNKLTSIAQKGRAAGICCVIATQRPSAKVFPGIIKASFSGKIAMRTSSSMESRIIIDSSGAEKITEQGAGIFVGPKLGGESISFRSPYINDISSLVKEKYPEPAWYNIFGGSKWKI